MKPGGKLRFRRILEPGEVTRLLSSSGPRRLLYELALWTGLRAHSLRQLRPVDLSRDADGRWWLESPPAKYCRYVTVLPCPADLADRLLADVAGRMMRGGLRGQLCPVPAAAARALQDDLDRAGIPYCDGGRYFDFHCFRLQCAAHLRASGASLPQIALWLGHRHVATTELYLRAGSRGELAAIAARFEGFTQQKHRGIG